MGMDPQIVTLLDYIVSTVTLAVLALCVYGWLRLKDYPAGGYILPLLLLAISQVLNLLGVLSLLWVHYFWYSIITALVLDIGIWRVVHILHGGRKGRGE